MKIKENYFIIFLFFLSPILVIAQSQKRFTLLESSQTGIKFNNKIKSTKDKNILLYANFYSGAGVGVGDFNNDGLQDIYFAGNMVPDKLYLNQGDFTFKDVTKQAGIKSDDGWSAGVTVADVNNDGYVDIYISRELYDYNPEKRANLLYINNGDGTFIESAERYGLSDQQRTRHATFFDYNKDGFLDVLLLTQPPNTGILSEFFGSDSFKAESHIRLLRNTGEEFFEDVTEETGIKLSGYPNSVSASDLNDDGWTDLYVANDFQEPDFLFINNKDGTFSNKIESSLNHTSHFSMGVDVADVNNDGLLDIFVVDMAAEDNFRSKSNMSGMNPDVFWKVVDKGGHYQYMFNTLQLNNGNGFFSDVAQITGMAATDWSWSNLIADLDNDGFKDTYVTNGLLHDIRNTDADKAIADFIDKTTGDWIKEHPDGGGITSIFDILDLQKVVNMVPSQPLSNYAYKNLGNLQFKKIMDDWGLNKESFSNGAAYADLDNDGDLELIVNNINDNAFVYKNNSEKFKNSNFLRVKLKDEDNKTVFGTKGFVYTNKKMQMIETSNVRGVYSTSEPYMHFGLGDVQIIDSIVVNWPNKKKTVLRGVKSNQIIELRMDEATESVVNNNSIKTESLVFEEQTGMFDLNYVHKENVYNDYENQVLLPHKMSQFGPALDVADVNNDGLDDVFIGGAAGYTSALYIQNRTGKFVKSSEELWEREKDYEDVDALFFDVNKDGYKDLYVVSGGNSFAKNDIHYKDRIYVNNGSGGFNKGNLINEQNLSGSVAKAIDFDSDGDLDLFVGGRHTPHSYPEPTSSMLFENVNGELINKTDTLMPELKNLGMVTDAIWTDYDSDGDFDLVVVGEWMPITIFKNQSNKFIKVQVKDFTGSTGWWFSIEKGDFDNDGDIDFVAGNLGLNYKYKTSKETPFDIYYSDFDKNGSKDIVLGYYNQNKHYPLRGFSCSSQQIPNLKSSIKKYDIFASLELEDIYGKSNLKNALHYKADSFATTYIENLGGDKFKFSELPYQAQISNVNDILIRDFNQDNFLDLVVVQNLFVSEIETTRNDAGVGLLLLGDGKGNFLPKTAKESGLHAKMDAKKIKTLKVKGKDFVLIANNNDVLQMFNIKH